jgi:hypothetical protein
MSYNRFLDPTHRRTGFVQTRPSHGHDGNLASAQSASGRTLVVLIRNGGVDLGIPALVDRVVAAIPGASSVITDTMRGQLVDAIREWLKTTTDNLLESAELSLNRYTAASPALYNDVIVLRDSTSTFGELRNALFGSSRAGRVIDLVILTHGDRGEFLTDGGSIDAAAIRSLRTEFGGPLNIRSVYMMNCVGSSLNQAWLDIGARTSSGTHENNYLPEPSTYFFWSAWTGGQSFETSVTTAYRRTIDAINGILRAALIAVNPLAGVALASHIDVSGMDFVTASRPEVVGAGSLTISSDMLPPVPAPAVTGQSLVTTVVPGTSRRAATLTRPMSTQLAVSPSGRSFIARWEQDWVPADVDVTSDVARRISSVEHFLSSTVDRPLTQPQVDALASFALGIGAQAFQRSTALRLVSAGDVARVPDEMRRWIKVRRGGSVVDHPGLVDRRRAEADLFAGTQPTSVAASYEVRQYADRVARSALSTASSVPTHLGPGDHVWYWNGNVWDGVDVPRSLWFPGSNPHDPNDYLGNGVDIFNFVIHANGEIKRGRPQLRHGEGSHAWLNNNPGNITAGGPDLGQYPGKVNWHNFLIFPDEATGYAAIAGFLRKAGYPASTMGGQRVPAGRYADLTIPDALQHYAPSGDGNDPTAYGAAVVAAAGVPPTTLIRDLTDEQMRFVQDKIKQIEGTVPGVTLSPDSPELPEVIRGLL